MHNCQDEALVSCWFPVAASSELPKRHVFHAQLLGEELAVWRSDEGAVNAWENRCPHRGVRLSIGLNLGTELKCRYHGMQFASGSGQCTFMPAHREMAPARALCAKIYRCRELDGYVWVTLGAGSELQQTPFAGQDVTRLRSLPINASALLVAEALTGFSFSPVAGNELAETSVEPIDAFTLKAIAEDGNESQTVMFSLQPVDIDRAIVHGAILGAVSPQARMAVLRHHNERLSKLRRKIEGAGARLLAPSRDEAKNTNAYRRLVDGRVQYGVAA